MVTVKIIVDHRLRVDPGELPDELQSALLEALEIPNLERENAKKHHVYGWQQMPETLPMYRLEEDGHLSIPRGFQKQLISGLGDSGLDVDIVDKTEQSKVFPYKTKIVYRDHQEESVNAILNSRMGIYKAPPGSGKTATVLAAGRASKARCLVVVNNIEILNQWQDRIKQFHELTSKEHVGRIGGGKFEVGYYWTIATAQTLYSRYDQLEEEGFFDQFGFVCLDEMHHCTADTYNSVMDRFSSKWRIGVSATPDKTGDFKLAEMVLGPIIHTTKHKGLIEKGYLIEPEIVKVKTDFKFNFRGTTSRWSRSNYPDLLKSIIADEKRNQAIVNAIKGEEGHHCLVLTKRLEHIEILKAMLEEVGYSYPVTTLTGKDKAAHREYVVDLLNREPCCVFSTLADEALDAPRLDRGFLVYPQKNVGLIEQQVGRFERAHPDKQDAKVYDFVDLNVKPLQVQWRSRLYGYYRPRRFKVTAVNSADL